MLFVKGLVGGKGLDSWGFLQNLGVTIAHVVYGSSLTRRADGFPSAPVVTGTVRDHCSEEECFLQL